MRSGLRLCMRLAAMALCVLVPLAAPASAQPASAPSVTDEDRNSPPYTMAVDARVAVRPDLTATIDNTVRFKVLRESAIRTLGQQNLSYVESLNPLEVVEAYTEKSDGRKMHVDPGSILTRDAATGLNAVYQRDSKVKTLIFPDVEVGDTLVYVTRTNRIDKRFPAPSFRDRRRMKRIIWRSMRRNRSASEFMSEVTAFPTRAAAERPKTGTCSATVRKSGRPKSRAPFQVGIATL